MRPTTLSLKRCLLLGSLFLASLQAYAAPAVSLVATPNPVGTASTVTLNVNASGFTDLYAWQFSVKFDPTLFQAMGATEGSFLAGAGSTFFDGGAIDNVGGTVSFSFDTLLSAVPGATGSGLLESLTFQSLVVGVGSFSLGDVAFLDSNLNDLAPATTSLSVSVVPEPAEATLLLAGLALLGLRRRRRS
jgi:MYXO-CTERM domain-containing protein